MKKQILIIILVGLTIKLNAQTNYGKGKYSVKFETPIGCPAELQSNNSNFKTNELNQIIPLLVNFPSEDKGYVNEFKPLSIYPYNKKGLEKVDYLKFAKKQYELMKFDTQKLSSLKVPIEFESLRNGHLKNREVKMPFYKALLEWTMNEDNEELCEKLLILCNNNSEVNRLLDSIFQEETWKEQFLKLSIRMSNLFNRINKDSFISVREIEKQLFLQYNIKCLIDPECTGC